MRLTRAGDSGVFRSRHPSSRSRGRAFLAILSCAVEKFSAKRFAEYLSLAQVPSLDDSGKNPTDPAIDWVASRDEVFGVLSERATERS